MQTVVERKAGDVSLLQILLLFARIGLTSFGGGLSAWIYREVVTQRGWLKEDEFLGALTLGQILPGSNVVNLSIYVGYRMRGPLGSTIAVCALLVPPMVVIVLLATVFHQFAQVAWLHRFLEGVAAAAIGMTASVGFRTARSMLAGATLAARDDRRGVPRDRRAALAAGAGRARRRGSRFVHCVAEPLACATISTCN